MVCACFAPPPTRSRRRMLPLLSYLPFLLWPSLARQDSQAPASLCGAPPTAPRALQVKYQDDVPGQVLTAHAKEITNGAPSLPPLGPTCFPFFVRMMCQLAPALRSSPLASVGARRLARSFAASVATPTAPARYARTLHTTAVKGCAHGLPRGKGGGEGEACMCERVRLQAARGGAWSTLRTRSPSAASTSSCRTSTRSSARRLPTSRESSVCAGGFASVWTPQWGHHPELGFGGRVYQMSRSAEAREPTKGGGGCAPTGACA